MQTLNMNRICIHDLFGLRVFHLINVVLFKFITQRSPNPKAKDFKLLVYVLTLKKINLNVYRFLCMQNFLYDKKKRGTVLLDYIPKLYLIQICMFDNVYIYFYIYSFTLL